MENGVAKAEVTDAENNATAAGWSVISSPPSGDMVIRDLHNGSGDNPDSSVKAAQFNASVPGLYQIGIKVTDGIDDTYGTFTVEVTDSVPAVPDVSLMPE